MLKDIHIQNYRGIKNLKIKDFKRINLLVGDNNSGKTSVLEAVGSGVNYNIIPIFNFESFREWGVFADLSKINLQDQKMWDGLEYLVYEKNLKDGFLIEATIENEQNLEREKVIRLRGSFSNEAKNFSNTQLQNPDKIIINQNVINSFVVSYSTDDENAKDLGFSRNGRYEDTYHNSGIAVPISFIPSTTTKAFELVDPMRKIAQENGESFFSNIAQTIDSKIKAIKTGGDEVLADIGRISVPLKYMGDGLISVLNILLKMRNLYGGILLIDEIENGLHWKTQRILWKAVIAAAKENNVQIIATTHSRDTIAALSEVCEEENLLEKDDVRVFQIFKKSKNFAESLDAKTIRGMINNNYEIR